MHSAMGSGTARLMFCEFGNKMTQQHHAGVQAWVDWKQSSKCSPWGPAPPCSSVRSGEKAAQMPQ